MLIKDKKHFWLGLITLVAFFIVLYVMFLPKFGGKNALDKADDLFNSLAKGSSYYFDDLKKKNITLNFNTNYQFTLNLEENIINDTTKILSFHTENIRQNGNELTFSVNLYKFLDRIIEEGKLLYNNETTSLEQTYGVPAKKLFFVYWSLLKGINTELKLDKKVKEADLVDSVQKRGVELAYNFLGIVPEKVANKAGILTFTLVFYVIYTLWFGLGIFYLFEGFGLVMKKGAKVEH